jgi:hypothetical protein
MANSPFIKVTGQGSRHEAAALGQQVLGGVSSAAATVDHDLCIDTLRLQLPSGASHTEINLALRRAIGRHVERGKS